MFRWGIIFLVIALIAAALGFGGLAGTAAGAAKIVCRRDYSVPGEFVHGPKTTLDFRPLRKFYPKPVQRTGFCGFSE